MFVTSKRFKVNPNVGFKIQLNLLWMQMKALFVKHKLGYDIIRKNDLQRIKKILLE